MQMAELASDNFEEVNKMLEVQFDAESEDNQEELHGKVLSYPYILYVFVCL